jgi:hypothetical protein
MLLNEENIRTLTQLIQVRLSLGMTGSIAFPFAGILVGIRSRCVGFDWSDEHFRENLFGPHAVVESSIQTGTVSLVETWGREEVEWSW